MDKITKKQMLTIISYDLKLRLDLVVWEYDQFASMARESRRPKFELRFAPSNESFGMASSNLARITVWSLDDGSIMVLGLAQNPTLLEATCRKHMTEQMFVKAYNAMWGEWRFTSDHNFTPLGMDH